MVLDYENKGWKMKTCLLLIVVWINQATHCSGYKPSNLSCASNAGGGPVVIGNVSDSLSTGDVIATVADLKAINKTDACDVNKLLEIHGNDLVLKQDIRHYCTCNTLMFALSCGTGSETTIQTRLTILRELVYNITTKNETYETNIREMSPPGTHLPLDITGQIVFEECSGTSFPSDVGPSVDLTQVKDGLFRWGAETAFNQLIVNGTIDYETYQKFNLQLKISYKAIKATTIANISVLVEDVDDNDPRFNISGVDSYSLKIVEANASLIHVPLPTVPPIYAYDPDIGINQTIVYTITYQPDAGLFEIDRTTGTISVTKELNRELKDSYRIVIQAHQTDNPSKAASAIVLVTVLDADDNQPEFNPKNYTVTLTEHVTVGTQVAQLTAHDPDEGDNSNFTCVLFNTSLPLSVSDTLQGCLVRVKDSEKFDRETFPDGIDFQVGTRATKSNTFGGNASVTIHLGDINDNSPKFSVNSYSFSLANVTNGSIIATIVADDPDDGGNGNVTYALTSSIVQTEDCTNPSITALPFDIDSVSGKVYKISASPNCRSYKTNINACDNPIKHSDRRCSLAQLTVTNTAPTEVQNHSQAMGVRENVAIGSYIQSVDQGCKGTGFTYTDNSNEFDVDLTGFVQTKTLLDRENSSSYNFETTVHDRSNKVICNLNITVSVLDVNDNAPVFSQSSYTFYLPAEPEDRQAIGTVKAEDMDIEHNADVRYMLQNQAEYRFKLNHTSGEISLISAAMVSTCDVISLAVVARDSGEPAMEAFAQIYIICHENNDSVPLTVPSAQRDIEKKKGDLERSISTILNITVHISDVKDLEDSTTVRSRVLLSATDPTVSHQQLLESVVMHFEAIRSLFYGPIGQAPDTGDSGKKFGAAEIALIAMGVVILIGTAIAIVIIQRQFNSHKRYKQLYESLTKNSSLYESQEIKMKMDDETSDYNGSVRSQDLGSSEFPRTRALAVSAINPGFIHDEQTVLNQTNLQSPTDLANTTVKEVIESLERLSDILDQEDINEQMNDVEPSTTSDDAPLVKPEHDDESNDGVETSSAVYANVTMNDTTDHTYVNNERFQRARNSLDMTPSDNIALKTMNDEADVNAEDPADGTNDDESVDVEPNPDYDVKQVRFSGEVLDADENILQPLKPDKAAAADTGDIKLEETPDVEQNADTKDASPEKDETGWLEEEIDSPVNTVVESENGKDFFFCDDALTHL